MKGRKVPVLVTWDVDPSPEVPYEARKRSLDVAMALCDDLGVRSTFFVTANAAHAGAEDLERMREGGHEIGCHGLTHTDEEEYNRMPEEAMRAYVQEATRKLASTSGAPIRAFRSPRLKISAPALEVLAESGYVVDSSICSQRMDLISSNLINPGWLLAPRQPYRPHRESAFKRGDLAIWEVPVSAAVVPFISAFLSVLGLAFMKGLFRLLYAESRRTGKPIVYLAHPIEFTTGWVKPFHLKQLSPAYIRTHGLLIRKRLYRMDSETWLQATRELFAYMASSTGVAFVPIGEYVASNLER
jgi:hypothetical protein